MEAGKQTKIEFPILRNGKPHVSYSEVTTYQQCPFRHKLAYIDGLSVFEPSPYLDYGTIVHDAVESFLQGKPMDIEAAQKKIVEASQRFMQIPKLNMVSSSYDYLKKMVCPSV